MLEQSSDPRAGRPPHAVTLETTETETLAVERGAAAQPEESGYRGRRLGWTFWLAVGWLTALVLAAVFANLLPYGVDETFRNPGRLAGPSARHWFGTDSNSRDVLTRVIFAARTSLVVSLSATFVGLVLGGALGLLAGYYRGSIETTITSALDVLLAIPFLVLALAMLTFLTDAQNRPRFGSISLIVIVALSIALIPSVARIARANVLVHAQREFVLASRTLGARNLRIMTREVLPNVIPAMLSFALLGIAILIVVEGTLAFLGVGELSKPTWGNMIAFGRDKIDRAPGNVLFPALFMFLTILSLNFIGDRIRYYFDVREAGI
jgi:peptide/nickel transport system permease protein